MKRYLSLALRHLVLFAGWIGLSLMAASWLLPDEELWRVWVVALLYYAVFFLVSLGGRWQRVLGIYLPVLYMKGLWYLVAVLVWLAALLAGLSLVESLDGLTAVKFPFDDLAVVVGLFIAGFFFWEKGDCAGVDLGC